MLLQAVRGISDLITVHGLINLDFADVRTIMSEMGMAHDGRGGRAAARTAPSRRRRRRSRARCSRTSRSRARAACSINITGGPDLTLHEVNEAATLIQEEADDEANIIFGAVIDESLHDQIRITVIATGFGEPREEVKRPPSIARRRRASPAAQQAQPAASSPRAALSPASLVREAAQSAAAMALGGPRRGHQDLDGTMWTRQGSSERGEPISASRFPGTTTASTIPTFLRKQAD